MFHQNTLEAGRVKIYGTKLAVMEGRSAVISYLDPI